MIWRRPVWRRYLTVVVDVVAAWCWKLTELTFRDGEPLHGWELMAASSICDLHGADSIVAADHFSNKTQEPVSQTKWEWWSHNLLVRILDCWCVGLRERPLDKPVHQTSFPNSWTINNQINNSLSPSHLLTHLRPRRWRPCSRCLAPACCGVSLALGSLTLLSIPIPPSYISLLWKTVNFNLLWRLTDRALRRGEIR